MITKEIWKDIPDYFKPGDKVIVQIRRKTDMEAPDNIYLYREKPKDYFDEGWYESSASGVENVAYIRKDALLEWAKERKEQVSIGLNAYDMGEENGKAAILNALIDKLNSL